MPLRINVKPSVVAGEISKEVEVLGGKPALATTEAKGEVRPDGWQEEAAPASRAQLTGGESKWHRFEEAGEGVASELWGHVKDLADDLEHGKLGAAWTELKDGVEDAGAEAVGLAELAGLRYGVTNYQSKVSDGLTRGSRLENQAAFEALAKQGFKSTVDLTLEGAGDARLAPAAGLKTLNVPILDNSAPTIDQMGQFLSFATKPENQPVYVHCEAGKGRTGVAVASYRMAVEGWTADQAIAEGKKFGLALPNQIEFLHQFEAALKAGQVPGFPLR